MKAIIVISCLFFINIVQSAKILGYFPFPSISHQVVFQAVYKELCLRGHEVVAITTNPLNDTSIKNLKEIDISESYETFKEMDITNVSLDTMPLSQVRLFFIQMYEKLMRKQFKNPAVKELLELPENYFDLIMVEPHHTTAYAWQAKFKVPIIGISSLDITISLFREYGISVHPVVYPMTKYGDFSFLERLEVVYSYLEEWISEELVIKPLENQLAKEIFGDKTLPADFYVKNSSLLIVTSNPLLSRRKAMVPNVVEISQVHIKKQKPLPKDLQTILDKAVNGVIYFSLGTNVRLDYVSSEFKLNVMAALKELPYTVLCKWDSDDVEISENVIVRKWFPQRDILAHPNIKAFVMQGGLQSIEEAITNAVPMVVIPFLGDQTVNANIMENEGVAVQVKIPSITKHTLKEAIFKVIKNETYAKTVKRWKNIFEDSPIKGAQGAAWWCEYVMRHNGARHLSSPVKNVPFYQYFLLDILLFLVIILTISLFVIKIVLPLFRKNNAVKNKKE